MNSVQLPPTSDGGDDDVVVEHSISGHLYLIGPHLWTNFNFVSDLIFGEHPNNSRQVDGGGPFGNSNDCDNNKQINGPASDTDGPLLWTMDPGINFVY